MPGGITSVFSGVEDFEAALSEEGCLSHLVAGRGAFWARLTQIALHHLRLSATEERLPRVALVAVPANTIFVSLPIGRGPAPIWCGRRMQADEIMTLGAGQRLHMRTEGACRWASMWLPAQELIEYGSALTEAASFAAPSTARWWRPRSAIMRHLRHLHSAAISLVETRSKALIDNETAHGLEQQLIDTLVESISKSSAIEPALATLKNQDVALGLETLLQSQPEQALRMAEICTMLGVSARSLRASCEEQVGMRPNEYVRRRRMQLVHRALRHENPSTASISATVQRYGFSSLRRFTADYCALFGELPSATLQRGSEGIGKLALRRPRMKFP